MKIYRRFLRELHNILYASQAVLSKVKPRVENNVPFVCQFAHPDHAELSLKQELNPKDDKFWLESGATSPDRYADWAFTMCGMASTSMALSHLQGTNIKPVVLAEDALNHNVYHEESEGTLSSMKYQEFADWITNYNLKATVLSRLSVRGIQLALSHEKLVIISVNPNIRQYDTAPKEQKGGHLVIVTGYDAHAGTITINNPSGFVSNNTQVGHTIPLEMLKKYYAGRGIILAEKTSKRY